MLLPLADVPALAAFRKASGLQRPLQSAVQGKLQSMDVPWGRGLTLRRDADISGSRSRAKPSESGSKTDYLEAWEAMLQTQRKQVPEKGRRRARCSVLQREMPRPSAAERKALRRNLRAQALSLVSIILRVLFAATSISM